MLYGSAFNVLFWFLNILRNYPLKVFVFFGFAGSLILSFWGSLAILGSLFASFLSHVLLVSLAFFYMDVFLECLLLGLELL